MAVQENLQMSLTLQKAVAELDMKINALADVMKRQNGLIPGMAPSTSRDHTEAMLYANTQSILFAFRPPRLPAHVFYPRLVDFGDKFLNLREYRLASRECFMRFLAEHKQAKVGEAIGESELMHLEMHARMGTATCDFFIVLESDPELRKMSTVEEIVRLLTQCRDIGQEIGGIADMYWLTYNNTITIMSLCRPLLSLGYASLAVEFLIFAALSLESEVRLNKTNYLGWRVRVYTAVCLAYEESKMQEEALSFAKRGLAQVQRLAKVEALDPVAPPADAKRILSLNELEMQVLVARYSPEADGASTLELFTNGSMGNKSLVVSSALKSLQDVTRRTLRHQPALETEASRPAMIEALVEQIRPELGVISKFITRRDAPPEAAMPPQAEGGDGEEAAPAADGEGGEEGEKEPEVTYAEFKEAEAALPLNHHVMLLRFAYNYESMPQFLDLIKCCSLRVKPEDGPPQQLALQVRLMEELYALEHPGEEPLPGAKPKRVTVPTDGREETKAEARVRRKLESLSRVSAVLSDLHGRDQGSYETTPEDGADFLADAALLLWNHTEPLMAVVEASAKEVPEMLPPIEDFLPSLPPATSYSRVSFKTEVSFAGDKVGGEEGEDGEEGAEGDGEDAAPKEESEEHGEAGEEGGEGAAAEPPVPEEPKIEMSLRQIASEVLKAIHGTFQWCRFDDGVVRAWVALRLAQTLESRGKRKDAVQVIEDAISSINHARFLLLAKEIDPNTGWEALDAVPSISTKTASTDVARRPNQELEQVLPCLQIDVLHCKYRLLLALGVEHSQRGAAGRAATNASTRLKRTREQTIYGSKSRKQIREEEEEAGRDQRRPLLPPKQWERDLVNGCNKNCYERAIVLIEMARLPRLSDERQRILQEAVNAIAEAEASEARIEDQVSCAPSRERTPRCSPPRLVMRSATAMIVSADPWRQPSGEEPKVVAGYSLYCKGEGSGVAVSLNNVEFRGTGITRKQGEKIIVHGLTPNESYVFAVAPMDPQGKVIGGVGATSVPVVALLPLPTLQLWGNVALSASQMKLAQLTRASGLRLYSHFVTEGPRRSLWEQNPADRDMLRVERIERAPQALLRVFAQVLIALTDLMERETLQAPQDDSWMVPEDFNDVGLKSHLLRLRTCKKLLMAVFIAAGIDDEELCCKACLRAYNLLLPLLQLRRTPATLLQAYSVMHSSVRVFLKAAAEASEGARARAERGVMHSDVRRVLCCLSKAMVGVSRDSDEPELLRSILDAEFEDQEAILKRDAEKISAAAAENAPPEGEGGEAPPPVDAMKGASEEQKALWEYLLSLPELQDKAKAYDGPLKNNATSVLPLLKGSPSEAWGALDKEDPRALELAARIVEEAIAENQGEMAVEWVKELEEKCKGAATEVVQTEPVVPIGEPLPSIDSTQEELDEEQGDKDLIASDEAERKDLEIQFLQPSEEQIERWEANKVSVEERRQARVEAGKERVEARREECTRRIQMVIIPKIKRARELRTQRSLIKKYGPGLATLKYLIATHKYSQVLNVDLSNPENHPEAEPSEEGPPPPEPVPEEGEGGEDGEAPPISLLPLAQDDPAYRPPVAVPGRLRLPLRALRQFVQGSRLACRNKLWVLMLNTCYQASNLVDEYFQGSQKDLAFVSSGMRCLAEDVLDFLEDIKACAENRPPPTATLTEVRAHTAAREREVVQFRFTDGIIHRLVDGNRTDHDRYVPERVSSLVLSSLKALLAGERHVAVLSIVHRLHGLAGQDMALTESLVPIMMESSGFVSRLKKEKNEKRAELTLLEAQNEKMAKELGTGGRLAEGLRARAKERAAMIIDKARLEESISELKRRLREIRFEAVDELPGTHVSTSKLHEEWVQIRKNIARDKSKSREDLEGCRMMLKSIYQRGAEAVAAKPPTPEPQGAKEGGGDEEGEAADAAADGGGDGGEVGAEGGEGGGEEGEESDEAKLDAAKEAEGNERAQRDAAGSKKSEPELLPGGVTRLELLGVAGEFARCISSLREKREKALLPLALGEYGQVLRLLGNLQGATRAWGDAIDSVFTVMQVGKNWRTIVPRSLMLRGDSTPSGEHLISQFGAWGILTAATTSTTLARYGHATDLHQQLELSLLAAHLFAVPFSSGLPHPQRAAEFAGYSPRELVAGFEPSSDTMRFEPASVMDAVEFAAPILLRNGLAVETLPMLTLYQYLAKEVVKDAVAYANACTLKGRACAAAGFVSEAIDLLADVYAGRGLPDVVPMDRPPKGVEGPAPKKEVYFDQSLDAAHESNQAAVAKLIESKLPDELASQFPVSLRHLLALTKGELLLRLVDSSPEWPHPNEALAPVCEAVEETLTSLRTSIFEAGKVEEEPPAAEDGQDGPAPAAPKHKYTRLSLGVMVECDLLLAGLIEKRGHLAEALEKLDEIMALVSSSGDAIRPEGAAAAQGEAGGDPRQHTHSHLWLQCRCAATRLLLAQGRYSMARQVVSVAQQEAASLNEQVLSREISIRVIQLDMHEGKTDLSLAAVQELVLKSRRLEQRDPRLASLIASFGELQRDHGMDEGALAAFTEAESLLLDHCSAHGLTENRCVYLQHTHLLARVQLSLAQLHAQAGKHDLSLLYCSRIGMVCGVSRDAPPSVLCGMHLQKARTLRLKLASASDGFGGVSYPAWGGGDSCTEEQNVAFQEAASALESALEQSGKEGMQDLKNIRAILIEYAALHALRILPDKAGERIRTSAHALKLAASVSAMRKRLMTYVEEQDMTADGEAPEWAKREVQESALEAARARARRAGDEAEATEAEAATNFRTLVSLYLAMLREKRLWLFDDEAYQVRLVSLHKAMCASFAGYKDGCCPPETILETLKATAPLEAGTVVSQCYALGDGPEGCNMMYAMALEGHAHAPAEEGAEGGGEQGVVVGRRSVSAREVDELAADWTSLRFSQRYEGMPEEEDATRVFPKYGNVMLQGDAAVAAQDKAVGALKEGAASAAMAVLSVRDAPAEAPEGYPALGEKKDLGSDDFLALLQLMLEDEGLDCVEPEFCAALAHAGLLHFTEV